MQKSSYKAIVLLSGGMDSTVSLYWAKSKFDYVTAIGFDYEQKHKIELVQASKIASTAGITYEIIPVKYILSGSSLVEHSKDHNNNSEFNHSLPASFVPGRNALFLTIAATIGFTRGVKDFVTGVCQTDYSGYPDCRQDFISAQAKTLSLALESEIKIHTPLMHLTKAETWKLAKELGCFEIVRDYSMTDYNGDTTKNEWGFGRLDNPASKLRAKGYYEALEKGWL